MRRAGGEAGNATALEAHRREKVISSGRETGKVTKEDCTRLEKRAKEVKRQTGLL